MVYLFYLEAKILDMKSIKPLLLISLLAFFTQCQKDESSVANQTETLDGKLAIDYMEFIRDMVKQTPGFTPPVASRAFGYAGLTLYESVVHGISGYQSLSGQINGLTSLPRPTSGDAYHWGQVANAAMGQVIARYFPSIPEGLQPRLALIAATYKTEYSKNISVAVSDRSTAFGIQLADSLYQYSQTDGGHEGYKRNFPPYTVPTGPGFWVPTNSSLIPLQPYWGNNRTFVKDITDHTQPLKHPEFSTEKTSLFYAQGLEVYSVTKNLSTAQSDIAKFWSDDPGSPGTPPGHSFSITSQILTLEKSTLAEAAEAYARMGIGVSDAFVSCWKCKYAYNLMRPVTYINQNIDPSWNTLLPTPPFPEYTSGHSVQSGATARILSELFGYGYSFVDRTHEKRTDINGAPRSFRSFDQFAQEAGISRLYGGIHFREAIDLGVIQGNKVGDAVMALPFKK